MRIKLNHFTILLLLVFLTVGCSLTGHPPDRRSPGEGRSNQSQPVNAHLASFQASPGPEGMAFIPGGTFEMGDHHNLGGREHGNDEVPLHLISLGSFFMATTEVTNQQYADYLNSALAQGLIEVKDGAVYGAGGSDLYFTTRQARAIA